MNHFGVEGGDDPPMGEGGPQEAGARITPRNAFSTVVVRCIVARNGARLEIPAPKSGYARSSAAVQLESGAWQSPELFAACLSEPFGPGP